MRKTVSEIAKQYNGTAIGDGEVTISSVNGIDDAGADEITFLGNAKYIPKMEGTCAAAVLVPRDYETLHDFPTIQVDSPYFVFAMLLGELEKETLIHPRGIHAASTRGENVTLGDNVALDAHVHLADNCRIGHNVVLYAGVYIGRNTCIGDNTVIFPNTTVRENSSIGKNCIIHSNVAIGSDGFGFTPMGGIHAKIPQVGRVEIGDDVEIGSNSAIDRATCGVTRIGNGTKIDNLVQIAHNVHIGEHTTISGMSAIAGSAIIGSNVTMAGKSGIMGHITVGDNSVVGADSGVLQSIGEGSIVSGFPAIDHKTNLRQMMGQRRLPQALRTIRNLEKRIEELEKKLNG
ncbi:MAG: UDP-3-O-(3-hydroxymyristoyl)glucosamine N-acyltransferase [Candidatus Hydrogenedentota bacterium]